MNDAANSPPNATNVSPISIEDEMRHSYLDYAMSVIVGRALPDVRDGLKPVHRRILFAMHELKNSWNSAYKKSARVVGDVIGKYHPHGDSAVYDALVRMAQNFSMREMLVDGQGNFGSVDGDPPAAMRYTEVRMAKLCGELLGDLEKDTVDFGPNYDDSLSEPLVMPAAFPNLLVNGSGGIAVGMATNIPPHNLAEVIDATIHLIRNPDAGIEELLAILPGPDFPTGATIQGRAGIYQAYTTGRGVLTVRAKAHIEEVDKSGKERLVVTELPFQVNKARLLERIAELVKEKKIEGISGLRDESDRSGMRMVVDIRRDAVGQVVLNQLYKMTALQSSFGIIFLAISGGRPRLLTLREALREFVDFREQVARRRCAYELGKAEARLHILEGLKIAIDNIDEVIALIRGSADPDTARAGLMSRFGLSEIQCREILAMRLQRLTGLERDKILAEIEELRVEITALRNLLENRIALLDLIVGELTAVKEQYGNPRRTEICEDESDLLLEDLIAEEDMVVTVSRLGYIKRTAVAEYRAQARGGKGLTGMDTREDDFVTKIFVASTHHHVLIFSDKGKAYRKKVYQIPVGGRSARGRAIVNFVGMEANEKVAAVLPVSEFSDNRYVLTATRAGYVKKTDLMAYSQIRSTGIIGVVIDEGDELVGADVVADGDHVILATSGGMSIRFESEQVRATGRQSRGVRGIETRREDGQDEPMVSMAVLPPESSETLLTVCQRGYGKRTPSDEYRVQNRGGRGLITIKTNERNGEVVELRPVADEDHLMLITDGGKIIRMAVSSISLLSRNTMGVRLIRLNEDEKVVGVESLADKESVSTELAEPPLPSIPPSRSDVSSEPPPGVEERSEHEPEDPQVS
ncbi:MAG: DNA gyrase subunit A [Myxococcota bacterium]|jgi:DNA gyrase subunit A|nr:DNA gyrase subunit A [Myxococcota bacterium]